MGTKDILHLLQSHLDNVTFFTTSNKFSKYFSLKVNFLQVLLADSVHYLRILHSLDQKHTTYLDEK